MDELYNTCRACAKDLNSHKYLNAMNKVNIFEAPDIAKKLASCISVELSLADEYPKFLCECCYQKVNDFHQFREMCRESIQHFEELILAKKSLFSEDEVPISILEDQSRSLTRVNELNHLEDSSVKYQDDLEKQTEVDDYNKKYEIENAEYCEQVMSTPNVHGHDENNCDSDVVELNNIRRVKSEKTSLKKLSDCETKIIYRCDICPSRFFVEHRLIAHKREHEGLMPYPCTQERCTKAFNRRSALARHLRQHEGYSFQYACDQGGCDKVYKHKPTLVMHQRKYHKLGPELKTHICEICGKVFKTTTMLNDHHYTHKDKSERPYACDQPKCMRRFSNKDKLKVHLMRHAGIKNYVCPHCGMRKTTMNELKVHINYHTLERTWPCRFCTHICNSSGNLKTHVRTVHERAKDYACRYCERTFAKPDTRKYHEMTHTGEKPNECPECGKRFLQPAALRTHRKIHQRQGVHSSKAKKCEKKTPAQETVLKNAENTEY
ncbi:zinc finger protein 888 isoform X2 [Bactrocera tryoni]|uniref:zinc finger protein 888 isoform X2 n=1 Tax=Bactrocera tryoni TaxID=59916 RepID=UPI001A97F60E|nr:zinc finger protein 888 isoform X2 [Bactrocera tryoni]